MTPSFHTFMASLTGPGDGVELGPDGAPAAFRIWRNGDNATDMGVHRFTDRSASELMAAQSERGNEFSIDCDHMSLLGTAPPESRKAVGWHRLSVRPDGLWAVDVRWAPFVVAGLTSDPPEWKYFSPAYETNKAGEIIRYMNTALTNNPRTWNVTALAAQPPRKETAMKYEDCLAALMGDDEDKKKEAMAAMKAAFGEDMEKKEEPKKEEAAEAFEGKETPKEEKKEESEKEEASIAPAVASLASLVAKQGKMLDDIADEKEKTHRASLLASRPDLPKALIPQLQKMSVAMMADTIKAIPVTVMPNKANAQFASSATRGETQNSEGSVSHRASMLSVEDRKELSNRMGTSDDSAARPFWNGAYKTYPQMSSGAARKYASEKRIQLPAPKPILAPVDFVGGNR